MTNSRAVQGRGLSRDVEDLTTDVGESGASPAVSEIATTMPEHIGSPHSSLFDIDDEKYDQNGKYGFEKRTAASSLRPRRFVAAEQLALPRLHGVGLVVAGIEGELSEESSPISGM